METRTVTHTFNPVGIKRCVDFLGGGQNAENMVRDILRTYLEAEMLDIHRHKVAKSAFSFEQGAESVVTPYEFSEVCKRLAIVEDHLAQLRAHLVIDWTDPPS